ncbi:outer membrane protein assembly factor [Pseudobdellovibrio exovorus]|uniref:Surface antigen n=1 Tax=Pseudobdellovibrio exovorus JSS TaxID=1184267 RepID=M4V712_9BACT|nr:outer membrane protein assembly factor [Pseudobdellovibrio exovorus]AGH95177.1 surface antigen [Pseudobdellovibrio exovorus JSS]
MKASLKLFIFVCLFSCLSVAAEPRYSVNLKDWPEDITNKIISVAPEIKEKNLSLSTLNSILKKIDSTLNFNSLKFAKISPNSSEVILIGEISPTIQKISFSGLSGLNETDALNIMGLNVNNILDEQNLHAGTDKLTQYYREQGYRFAQVSSEIVHETTIAKSVLFTVDRKQKTQLSNITLTGLNSPVVQRQIEKSLQRNFWRSTVNQETLSKINTRLRGLLSNQGYYQTQIPSPQIIFAADELSARLSYKFETSPRFYIEVINSHRFEHTYLEDDILKLNTFVAKDGNMIPDLIEDLKAFYVAEGFPHVEVTSTEITKDNINQIFLNVQEGPFTKIADFTITGQYSRDENFYKKKFYELSSQKVQDKTYLKEDIELAAKNLLIYLQNDGYVNAKLSRIYVSTEKESPQNGIILLQLDEGQQVKLSDVQFTGVSEEYQTEVQGILGTYAGQNLSLIQLENNIVRLKEYYQEKGYIEYELVNEGPELISYSDNNSEAKLNFKIKEGPLVKVQSILIEGNTRTKDRLIHIELDFKAGDTLTPQNIDESVARLQRTGHFNSVEITTLEKDSDISQRTVLVKVVERDPGVRLLGFGLTDENRGTLHGYAGIAYRNFFGWGVGLSARAELNYNFALLKYLEQKYIFGFVWPYLFDSRARFRTSATRSNTIADVTINKVTEAHIANFAIEQDFTSHVTGIFAYNVATYKDHGITNEDEIKYNYRSESLVIGSIGPTIDLDYRDNLFNPTKGSFSRLAAEYSTEFLGNNNVDDFYRIIGQTTHYFPINNDGWVFVQSLRGGYIKNIDSKGEGVPFDKRGFLLGGRTTIRGFESSEFFPSNQEIGASYRLLSSSSYELVKSEIRFPLSHKYDLSGAVFYDGGQVRIEGLNLTNKWRDAVGIAFRYNTPIGPLNLEYGHKLDKKAGESDGAFYLSVGVF